MDFEKKYNDALFRASKFRVENPFDPVGQMVDKETETNKIKRMTNEKVLRRNLSGIYIFDTLEGERKRKPTCIEDCNEATRREWLRSLEPKARIDTANVLCETIVSVADFAHTEGMIERESREILCREVENCRVVGVLDNLLKLCDLLRLLGDRFGLVSGEKGGEE